MAVAISETLASSRAVTSTNPLRSNANGYVIKALIPQNDCQMDILFKSLKDAAGKGLMCTAFKTFSQIQLLVSPSCSGDIILLSISSLLLSCANISLLTQGKQLHAHAISHGIDKHHTVVHNLVNFYTSANLVTDAHSLIRNANVRGTLLWNILIDAYVKQGFNREALLAYKEMVSRGITPDSFTYPPVFKACGKERDIKFGREVHKLIEGEESSWSMFVQNSIISMYMHCGDVEMAHTAFDTMPERDIVSWNSMISGYASNRMWKNAFALFNNMQSHGVEINVTTWNTVASGCLQVSDFEGALGLLSQMRNYCTDIDSVTLLTGLIACSHIGTIKLGREIHGCSIRTGYNDRDNVRSALITMYSRCKHLKQAYLLFQLAESKTMVTWNSMISGCSHLNKSEEASFLFRKMLHSGVQPNYVTIASILPSCARVANLQQGKEFHCYIVKHKTFQCYLLLWNALVDMYGRSGKILDARKLFDSLAEKDECTYTSLIAAYGIQGDGEAAIELFEDMNRRQIKPDHVTMVAVLSACSHSGLVVKGETFFENMTKIYGIIPLMEHFSCMVDLFARSGLVNKAVQIIKKMPCNPTPAMWATLVSACCVHKYFETGEWAAGKLLESGPKHAGYYVIVANLYAAAGLWNRIPWVRSCMRQLDVKKDPGSASVDTNCGFESFLAGDTSNAHLELVYPLLDGLNEVMKDAVSSDMKSHFEVHTKIFRNLDKLCQ